MKKKRVLEMISEKLALDSSGNPIPKKTTNFKSQI